MIQDITGRISAATYFSNKQISAVLAMKDEGATIPFMARYRKEKTGNLDEVQIQQILDLAQEIRDFEQRKVAILKSIEEQGKLSDQIQQKIDQALTLTELEDIYLPFKQKRKTKASKARELGLEPLAGTIMKQDIQDLDGFARKFVKGDVAAIDEALSGARDIIAEWVSERIAARNTVRKAFQINGEVTTKVIKGKEEDGIKYKDYFSFSEPLRRMAGHRFLAVSRGEVEGILRMNIAPENKQDVLQRLERVFIRTNNQCSDQIKVSIKDSYTRLIAPSIETEAKNEKKEKSDDEAIKIFAENLRQLLLAPPVGSKRVLAIDPGFRTGCKVVCLDEKGDLLHNETIYPHPPQNERSKAMSKLSQLVQTYQLEAIAIGNGTAGRETEQLVQKTRLPEGTQAYVVNESGASIYSASKVAREEFPNYDVTVRGAVSIGRRLMDPLAELVKIDPKNIGVGQYQHDVDQKKLKTKLDQVVESAVNTVGVNINTASKHLLQYVSGIGPKLAESIVEFRTINGAFENRSELKKVAGLGPKAFEQSAGFLRVPNGNNPLDNTAVHPESYGVVKRMAQSLNKSIEELLSQKEQLEKLDLESFVTNEIGLLTLQDIVQELKKPGRDPRGKNKVFEFDPTVKNINDLKVGQELPGIVTNLTKFGAFVDVGVKQDGLVHVSQLADRFVSDPTEVVRLQQHVRVKVLEVDTARNRIAFTMKGV